jgi:hypothetical protein
MAMCNFLSAIALPNGDLLSLPDLTDSHEDLISYFALDDKRDEKLAKFARVEFAPSNGRHDDVESYQLMIDEQSIPTWLTDEMQEVIKSRLRTMVSRMIIKDSRRLLLGGCWILSGEANIDQAKHARIIAMRESSQVGEMRESSRVGEMRESSQVGAMRESSQVGAMRGSSQVGEMRESSQVGAMRESSQVGAMRESSQVGAMWESSQVGAQEKKVVIANDYRDKK